MVSIEGDGDGDGLGEPPSEELPESATVGEHPAKAVNKTKQRLRIKTNFRNLTNLTSFLPSSGLVP